MIKSARIFRKLTTVWLIMMLAGVSCASSAELLDATSTPILVNSELFLLTDVSGDLSAEQAISAFNAGQLKKNVDIQVSFGFTENTIWAILPVTNSTVVNATRNLSIENAWLDQITLYFYHQNELSKPIQLGDTVDFNQRSLKTRMPSVEYAFKPGVTYVVMRFRSEDPMTIPVYLGSQLAMDKYYQQNAYFYGALYGILVILLIYNLVLFGYLRERRYGLYSLYLFAFTAFNFTYTGHGFWLVWSSSIELQQWLMPFLMFCYILMGISFSIEYLHSKEYLPSLYAKRYLLYGGIISLGVLMLLMGSRSIAVMIQLLILTTMSIWMVVIGYHAYKNGNPIAKFFIPAVLMGTGGATVSSLATWGLIPYSQWAFRGIEIGLLLEMTLLSVSLGFNFKVAYEARKSAEINARLDPLTNLFNRRAFTDLVYPIWNLGKRKNSVMTIMLIDLDWFKRINDKFGHSVGDAVLEQVADVLKSRLRHSDIILRWGGEEFLIFLPDTTSQKAKLLAEKLRLYFSNTSLENAASVTISVGIASGNPRDISLDKLIQLADDSLYQAKKNGRNQVVLMEELSTSTLSTI